MTENVVVSAGARKSSFSLWVNVYIIVVFLVLFRFGITLVRWRQSFVIGDWLINYHGGFIRRGLIGEAVLYIARLVHVSPPRLVFLIQMSCYLCLLLVFRRLVLDSDKSPWVVALLVSPATLAFPFFFLGSGYRKEILFFASLSILIYLLSYKEISSARQSVFLCLILPIIILSHESLFFYLLYYFAAIWIASRSWRRSILIIAAPLALSCVAVFFAVRHPGNLDIAKSVCQSDGYTWKGEDAGFCGGAIYELSVTKQSAHDKLLTVLARSPLYKLYPLLALLAFLPVIAGFLRLYRFPSLRPSLKVLGTVVVLSCSFSIAILYYAEDWGRFIYMHVMAAALLILMVERVKQNTPNSASSDQGLNPNFRKVLAWVLIPIYACCWELLYRPDPGYSRLPLGVVRLVRATDLQDVKNFFNPRW